MNAKNKLVLALLTGTIGMTSLSVLANDQHRDFRVCAPYRLEVESLSSRLANFESEVMEPLKRELAVHSSRVNQRVSTERKLESVVVDIERNIRNSESRLSNNPAAIVANRNAISASNNQITSLRSEIAGWQREMEDVGFIKRGVLKRKIKGAEKDIEKEQESIQRSNQNIARMQAEQQNLPTQIQADRSRLATAESNLRAHRNLQPTLDSLRDAERDARNRLDSQEDIKREYRENLRLADIDLGRCKKMERDAMVYSALSSMSKRLKAAECNMDIVRNRLPYDTSKLELMALGEAFEMTCETVITPAVGGQGGHHQ